MAPHWPAGSGSAPEPLPLPPDALASELGTARRPPTAPESVPETERQALADPWSEQGMARRSPAGPEPELEAVRRLSADPE